MHHQDTQYFRRFMPVLGILAGIVVGSGALADSEAPGSPQQAVLLSGVQVYNNVCIACHVAPGYGGAPALGNAEAWEARIEQGIDTLVSHALNGYSGSHGIMPKKGGRLDLSDEEITAAVVYMVEQLSQ